MESKVKNNRFKLWFTLVIFALFAYYIFSCVVVNQSRNKLYNATIKLRLMIFCNNILQETYHEYLGPSRDDNTTDSNIGTYRQIAEVYFPGIAPQTVSCFIQQDKTWIGYDTNTMVKINLRGVKYAPTWFDKPKELNFSFYTTTLGQLAKNYYTLESIKKTKKPIFKFLHLTDV